MLTQIVDDIQVMTKLDTMREPDPMKVPATALWVVSISDTDLEKLKAGFIFPRIRMTNGSFTPQRSL